MPLPQNMPHQRQNRQKSHCVANILPHNGMLALTFAGMATGKIIETAIFQR
ncbi:hypothetical protein BIFBIF_01075 [Bifidobacterium bifidum ATCC 29521 = JCM 1255 = DSM 20456]|nr:hypothetical protein BIFBIF_01075 [Bifidobacterium bifidum ATCC 29521 = JCM 1255 = DSM 20456]